MISRGSLGTNLSPHKRMRTIKAHEKEMQIWGNPLVSVFMCLPGLLWVCGDVY